MASQSAAVIGSGTPPFTAAIIPTGQRGTLDPATAPNGRGLDRVGTNVVLINPEDLNSVDAFAVSGITVGTTAVEILSPGTNPLPRMREVQIQNLGTQPVYVGQSQASVPIEGLEVAVSGTPVILPILHNVSVWAATESGTASIRMIIV